MTGIEKISCLDTEYMSQVLRHTNVRAMQISRGIFAGSLTRYCVGGWNIQRIEFASGTSACFGDSPRDRFALLLPLTFTRYDKLLGRPVGTSSVAVYAPGSEHGDVTSAGTQQVVLVPPTGLLEELPELREMLPRSGSQHRIINESKLANLRRLIEDFHEAVSMNAALLESGEVGRTFQDAMVAAFRIAAADNQNPKSRGRPEHSRPTRLRELREAVTEANGEPMYASELCRTLKVSFPTLRRIFLDWYGIPPARYLLLRRYYLARERLSSGACRSVGEAAQSCGFWNPSRFASSYKSLFRELPSATLANAECSLRRRFN